jgi:hypothetical protein
MISASVSSRAAQHALQDFAPPQADAEAFGVVKLSDLPGNNAERLNYAG